jgi:phosphomevalonate kinase
MKVSADSQAGGYDAVWVLALDAPEPVAAVEGVWADWTEMSVCPLAARQSDGGLQRETRAANGLAAALERVW